MPLKVASKDQLFSNKSAKNLQCSYEEHSKI